MKNVVYPRVIEKFGVVQVDFEKEGDFGYLTRYNKMISPDEVSEKDFFEFMEVLFNGN